MNTNYNMNIVYLCIVYFWTLVSQGRIELPLLQHNSYNSSHPPLDRLGVIAIWYKFYALVWLQIHKCPGTRLAHWTYDHADGWATNMAYKKGVHLPNKVIVLDLWRWFFVPQSLEGDGLLSLLASLAAIAGHLITQFLNLHACQKLSQWSTVGYW